MGLCDSGWEEPPGVGDGDEDSSGWRGGGRSLWSGRPHTVDEEEEVKEEYEIQIKTSKKEN